MSRQRKAKKLTPENIQRIIDSLDILDDALLSVDNLNDFTIDSKQCERVVCQLLPLANLDDEYIESFMEDKPSDAIKELFLKVRQTKGEDKLLTILDEFFALTIGRTL